MTQNDFIVTRDTRLKQLDVINDNIAQLTEEKLRLEGEIRLLNVMIKSYDEFPDQEN